MLFAAAVAVAVAGYGAALSRARRPLKGKPTWRQLQRELVAAQDAADRAYKDARRLVYDLFPHSMPPPWLELTPEQERALDAERRAQERVRAVRRQLRDRRR